MGPPSAIPFPIIAQLTHVFATRRLWSGCFSHICRSRGGAIAGFVYMVPRVCPTGSALLVFGILDASLDTVLLVLPRSIPQWHLRAEHCVRPSFYKLLLKGHLCFFYWVVLVLWYISSNPWSVSIFYLKLTSKI